MGPAGPFFFDMTTTYGKERDLQSDIAPRVEHDVPGVEVLAVELESPDRFVVYVEHAEGVDHALCARVTDVIRDYLRDYTVTVSSPGVERPLRKPAHFARVVDHRIAVRTSTPIDGRSRFKGYVRDAGHEPGDHRRGSRDRA
jgi:ribosome maturation factor RimP